VTFRRSWERGLSPSWPGVILRRNPSESKLNISAHQAILANALSGQIRANALRLITLANLVCDVRQLSPEWHFDSAPDRDTILLLWQRGCKRGINQAVRYCQPLYGRLRNPRLALIAFGATTHAIADFYAHTNWIELYLNDGYSVDAVPLAPLLRWSLTLISFLHTYKADIFIFDMACGDALGRATSIHHPRGLSMPMRNWPRTSLIRDMVRSASLRVKLPTLKLPCDLPPRPLWMPGRVYVYFCKPYMARQPTISWLV